MLKSFLAQSKPLPIFYRNVWLSAFAGSLLLLCSGLFIGTIAIDDELHLFSTSFDGIGRGLWGLQFTTYILPGQLGISFAPMLTGILLYASSTTILIYYWRIEDQTIACLSAAIIGSFPYFAAMMTFDVAQVAYPLGFVFITLSLYPVFFDSKIYTFIGGIIAFAFAFSLYQGVATHLGTVFISSAAMRIAISEDKLHSLKETVKTHFPRVVLLGLFGTIAYLSLTKLFQISIDHNAWNSGYQVNLNLEFWDKERFESIIFQIYSNLTGYRFDLPKLSVLLFFILISTLSITIFFANRIPKRYRVVIFILLWVSILITPYLLLFVQTKGLAPRSTVGLGIFYAFSFAALASVSKTIIRKILILVSAIWIFQFIFLGNEMYYTQHLSHLADRDTANRIAIRIDNLDDVEKLPFPIPTTFVGKYTHPYNKAKKFSVLGASVFEWDGGSIRRQTMHFKLMSTSGLDITNQTKEKENIRSFIKENAVPEWPEHGSVFIYQNRLVVVNFGL